MLKEEENNFVYKKTSVGMGTLEAGVYPPPHLFLELLLGVRTLLDGFMFVEAYSYDVRTIDCTRMGCRAHY